jgi:hypothetical protein
MTSDELDRALRQLRLSGMADTLTVRTQQARAETLGPQDYLSLLVHDELERRRDRLVERRVKHASFRDRKSLDTFNWGFPRGAVKIGHPGAVENRPPSRWAVSK